MRQDFLAELKRRNVYRAAALYAAVAWLLIQIATQVFPFFDIPNPVVRWIVILLIAGLPLVLLFSWFYELTPEGLKRESEIDPAQSDSGHIGRKLDHAIIAVLAAAVVLLLIGQFTLRQQTVTPKAIPVGADAPIVPSKSVAVLPLSNESGDPDNQYFSDGLSEELISDLTRVDELKVIGRSSSFQFRNSKLDSTAIGAKLGVATLLEGTVRQQGSRIRIVIGLINAGDGSSLWSQTYDRELDDIFAIQSEIAQSVAGALQVKLLGAAPDAGDKPPSGNVEAYKARMQGKFYAARFTERDERKAIELFNTAVSLDPRYASAYAGLTFVWINLANDYLVGVERAQGLDSARAAADTALALGPNLALAHRAHAFVLSALDFDQAAAVAEYRRALELTPNDAGAMANLAVQLSLVGRLEESVAMSHKALAVDPLRDSTYSNLSIVLAALNRLDDAARAARKGVDLQPASPYAHEQLATVDLLRGDTEAVLHWAAQETDPVQKLWFQTLAWSASGERAKADAALRGLIDQHGKDQPYLIALVYAFRKKPDEAFDWLERAQASRDPGIINLLTDPFLKRYQHDPRFAALCSKIGLPPPGEATVNIKG